MAAVSKICYHELRLLCLYYAGVSKLWCLQRWGAHICVHVYRATKFGWTSMLPSTAKVPDNGRLRCITGMSRDAGETG